MNLIGMKKILKKFKIFKYEKISTYLTFLLLNISYFCYFTRG